MIRAFRLNYITTLKRYRNSCIASFVTTASLKATTKNLESYERKTPIEHILLRPGMYIGEVEPKTVETWVYNEADKLMSKKVLTFSPALIKVFDEILVNAADNFHRKERMTRIDIHVKIESNRLSISIRNDGKGIPVELHPKENIYIPELIFGHLLTGSNFNDDEKRLTGGRHGYGAKLTNIFSTKFVVETYDSLSDIHYKQEWSKNMTIVGAPEVTTLKPLGMSHSADFTQISFDPDLTQFHMGGNSEETRSLIDDSVLLLQRRTLDIAACLPAVEVYFNNRRVEVSSFADYVKLFGNSKQLLSEGKRTNYDEAVQSSPSPLWFYHKVSDRWDVGVTRSPSGSFESMSFVNGVWTPDGGSHVNLVASQLLRAFDAALTKKGVTGVNANMLKNKLMLIVRATVENPIFESQSKLLLTSKPATFGSSCELPVSFVKQVVEKSGVLEEALMEAKVREESKLLKMFGGAGSKGILNQVINVPKLEDAINAGNAQEASHCTLILTEGDSAKALAIAGLEIVGREYYGVLPLRGKILNVRVATKTQAFKSEELRNICTALGLKFSETYENGIEGRNGLRYGKVLLMCDQDHDGSHIKGLVINFFHHFWPHLLERPGFMQQFITPLVKVFSGSPSSASGKYLLGKQKPPLSFYSMQEYLAWRLSTLPGQTTKQYLQNDSESTLTVEGATNIQGISDRWHIKYYKGLGTNTSVEGQEYFRALDHHRKNFLKVAGDDEAIDLAFAKTRANDRRDWLASCYSAESFIDPKQKTVSYTEFVNKELIHFSHSDNQRSIPSVVDGLKPSQRKILFACFKKNLISDMKVVQLAGYVAEHTAYHHGETSLHAAIVNMAQDFVGSNNIPLLVPSGQFGTRHQGGTDYASPRYIFTRLSPLTRLLFPADDDDQLERLEEDGALVEPKFYLPTIPSLLINGAQGIGTGWSTSVPSYNPIEIAECVSSLLRGTNSKRSLHPWVREFRGVVLPASNLKSSGIFESCGIVSLKYGVVEIDELPVGKWTEEYKKFLCQLCEEGLLKGFTERHTTATVKFVITPTVAWSKELAGLSSDDLLSQLKLKSSINLNNMTAFDPSGALKRYESPEEVIAVHFPVRMQGYETRKAALLRHLVSEEARCMSKSRFIELIINGSLDVFSFKGSPIPSSGAIRGADHGEIVAQLRREGFMSAQQIDTLRIEGIDDIYHASTANGDVDESEESAAGYGYLLNMPLQSLTESRFASLRRDAEATSERLAALKRQSAADLWQTDLDKLLTALHVDGSYNPCPYNVSMTSKFQAEGASSQRSRKLKN